MEQTSLAIEIDERREPPIALSPRTRSRVVELMATAVLAAHGAAERPEEESADDDARD